MTNSNDITIPDGYVLNANGDLINEKNLTNVQRGEDTLVRNLFAQAQELHNMMGGFKYAAMNAVEHYITDMLENEGVKKFEKIKGNVTFTSVDSKFRVKRSINDRLEPDSTIEAARQKFSLYKNMLIEQSGSDAAEFIDDAFKTINGKYDVAELQRLASKDIKHPLYKAAAQAIVLSLKPASTKAYLNFYFREKSDQQWEALPLQLSSITPIAPETESEQVEEATATA